METRSAVIVRPLCEQRALGAGGRNKVDLEITTAVCGQGNHRLHVFKVLHAGTL